jgi:hypothetical protein
VTDRQERQRRLDRARKLGRFELAVAFAAIPFSLFLLVAAPGSTGPMFVSERVRLLEVLIPAIGFGGMVVGLAWMIRIHRADPEAGERSWRYHDL